ncbi:hypothetical protein MG296_07390 [Flavobacteriaceae bacterium TK19130]|nr:hypothetical protein [Thermobacterium salinum]
MSTLTSYKTLVKNTTSGDDLDFDFLRKKGIEYIESMGSALWTDYNSHDPGITILEVLAYAITDLGARMKLPMEDILAEEGNREYLKQQFLTAEKALPIKPVSPSDYRKLFIDIPGIKNAWLRRHEKTVYADCKNHALAYKPFEVDTKYQKEFVLNGLYDVLLDFDTFHPDEFDTESKIEAEKKRLKDDVRNVYHAHRNLCEDIVGISEVEPYPVSVCAQIEVAPDADEERIHAKILDIIDDYLSPALPFYSLKEMIAKGIPTDEIYNGPLLTHGFIENEELANTELRTEVRLSDIIYLIQQIEGVEVIKDITLQHCEDTKTPGKQWVLCVPKGTKPVLCNKSVFSYYKGFLPLNIDLEAVEAFRKETRDQHAKNMEELAALSKELDLPEGTFSNIEQYESVQNDLPEVYGTGPLGPKGNATMEQRAKIRQLKGYLLFFDQILASYFAHLQKVKAIFSVNGELRQSYFTQALTSVTDLSPLVSANYTDDTAITDLLFEDLDDSATRRNAQLDHLLARFAESFSEYAFLMKQLYDSDTDEVVMQTKEGFLQQYHVIGCERPLAFNYYKQEEANLWDTDNVSAFQKRIALLTGNPNFNRRNFSDHPLEIYEEIDTDGIIEYRFRIRREDKTILQSSSKHYHSLASLYKEVFNVRNFGRKVENYEIKTTDGGKFYFNLTNPNIPDVEDEGHVIARKIGYYASLENAEASINETVEFMNSLDLNEGMFLFEHILLRPDVTKNTASPASFLPICEDNCEGCEGIDPYSFRVSIVLPGWTERYSNVDFRRFMEHLIRKELPAHIVAKICWIGYPDSYDMEGEENEMMELEAAYQDWLFSKTKMEQAQPVTKLKRLNDILSTLHTIYPQGRLHDCDDENEQQHVILGRTNLGKL